MAEAGHPGGVERGVAGDRAEKSADPATKKRKRKKRGVHGLH